MPNPWHETQSWDGSDSIAKPVGCEMLCFQGVLVGQSLLLVSLNWLISTGFAGTDLVSSDRALSSKFASDG